MEGRFRVGLTRDFLNAKGELRFGIGLELVGDRPDIEWEYLARDTPEVQNELVRGYDALLVLAPKVTPQTLEGNDRLAIIARFGVGYDSVDVNVGAELAGLCDLVRMADFVCICAALTDYSRYLIDARRLALMMAFACLINVARVPIVD